MDGIIDIVFLPLNDWRVGLLLLIIAFYVYLTWTFDYFKKRGIPFKKPYPLLGTLNFLKSFRDDQAECMSKYGKVYGTFINRTPMLAIADEELLREILLKDFTSFPNHTKSKMSLDKYMDRLLTVLRDDEWKNVRRILTPTFTAGKLKQMAPNINKCATDFVQVLSTNIQADNVIDMKTLSGNYTMDVIARTAFGLETKTQTEPDNDFVKHGKAIMTPRAFAIFVMIFTPWLVKYLKKIGISIFKKDSMDFFIQVVDQILEMRKSDETVHHDFIGMMATAHKMKTEEESSAGYEPVGDLPSDHGSQANVKALDKLDIVASGFLFFLAGFDTVSTGLSVTMHHIAANPDCQQKLLEEIEGVMQDKTMVTYDLLNQMPYLEMCIMESLRLDSPAPTTDRQVNKDVTINGIHFEKDLTVLVPIHAIHHCPEYWPNPEKFDPERFTPEAKATRSPYLFLPFGLGPRDCIGKRLALMEMKTAIIYIIRRFKLLLADGDKAALNFHKFGQLTNAWLKIEKRET